MSIRVMTAVWEMSLPAKDKLVLLALADCANDEGIAWPSIATLARKCGCDERTVQRNLRTIEAAGIIRREEVIGKGNKFYFNPRQIATPGKKSPVTKTTQTPGKLPPNPSRTVKQPHSAREAGKHLLPANWEPEPFAAGTESAKVVAGWPPGKFQVQLERFTAHHRAAGNKFSSWQAAWSKWVLNDKEFQRGGNIRGSSTAGPDKRSGLARAIDSELGTLRAFP